MWSTDQLGKAIWSDHHSQWAFDARGGEHGISIATADSASRLVSFGPVDQELLPKVAEQYVRGNQWHINYPQGDGRYAIRLVLQPIETTSDQLVIEAMVSIQTDLLDSYPKVDIDIDCQSIDAIVPADPTGDDEVDGAGSAPISIAISQQHCCSVLLGPHDQPFTTNHSTDSLLRLRLFGEFLEKGVIRRGRPWIVIDCSGKATSEDRLVSLWQQLCDSPVPLT